MNIGIFGGSFDPVHNGHLAAARAVLARNPLDAIWFVPARVSPLKIGHMRADDTHRLAMLRLALSGEPRFELNDYEINKGGISFTIDTIRHFRAENPNDDFSLIIGADSLATFPKWKDAEQIMNHCRIIVLARRGASLTRAEIQLPATASIDIISDFDEPVSSSEIRRKIASGETIDSLLPAAVAEYAHCHGLYSTNF